MSEYEDRMKGSFEGDNFDPLAALEPKQKAQKAEVQEKPMVIPEPPRFPEDPASPYMQVDLPRGAKMVGDPKLWDRVLIHEFMGEQEDILASDLTFNAKINKILSSIIVEMYSTATGQVESKKPYILALFERFTSQDVYWLLIQARRTAFGDMFGYELECPRRKPDGKKCAGRIKGGQDLRKIKMCKMAPEDAKLDIFDDVLSTGKKVRWEPRLVEHDRRIDGYKDDDTLPSAAILLRVKQFGDTRLKWDDEESLDFARTKISMRERQELRKLFKKREAQMDLSDDYVCPKCGGKFNEDLPILSQSFFTVTELPEGLSIP